MSESLVETITRSFENYYKMNKTPRAFDELYQDVLKILAVHEEKLRELADMLKHRPHRTSIFFLTWFDEFEKKFVLLFSVESMKDTKKEK